ncbi:MAG: hypothetical protein QME21_10910 [Anaerolineales bacterium]|nr:hypothetical protein [Anaerolineales bacterium]
MKNHGLATVAEFLGDWVLYRNLQPCEARLPRLEQIRSQLSLPNNQTPRKSEREYAQIVVQFLKHAYHLDELGGKIERLIFVGDTRLLDGAAFMNLCAAGEWPGIAFIGAETHQPAEAQITAVGAAQTIYQTNRWVSLLDFDQFCRAQGLPVEQGAAVVIDLDKTTLGARGRNDKVIDQARVQAVQETVAHLLGSAFDLAAFRAAYLPLNQPEFHPFTSDNQDYLAYVCLILGFGLYSLEELTADIRSQRLTSFEQFILQVEERRSELSPELAKIHTEIYRCVQAGDPTPFKSFRRREYLTTMQRFGCLSEDEPVERYLEQEIVITHEVRKMALEWRERGALLFGLSDKPDEAALPTSELAAQGYLPLHHTPTHAIGEI